MHKIDTADVTIDVPSVYAIEKLFTFTNIQKYFVLYRFFKYFRLAVSRTFFDKIIANVPRHPHLTRFTGDDLLNVPSISVSRLYSSFVYLDFKLWNSLPRDLRDSNSFASFKINIRERIDSLYYRKGPRLVSAMPLLSLYVYSSYKFIFLIFLSGTV